MGAEPDCRADCDGVIEPSLMTLRAHARRRPQDAAAQHALGKALAERGDVAEALASLRAAVHLSADVALRADLADLLACAGDVEAAAQQYRAALALRPDRGDVWLKLGWLYAGRNRVPTVSGDDRAQALRAYRQAIACAPSVFLPYIELYRLLLRDGTLEDALAETQRLNGRGDPEQMARALAYALKTQGRKEEAIAYCSRILSRSPGDQSARITRAECFTALREFEAATADFEEALRTHPTSGHAAWASLLHLIRLGHWDEAQERFRAARQHLEPPSDRADRGLPAWDGLPAPGKTLLIEFRPTLIGDGLGYGDLFQQSRFLALARDRGLHVVAEFPKPMVAVMRSVPGPDAVVRPHDRAFPVHYRSRAFNVGLLLASPGLGGSQPYIRVSRQRRVAWRRHCDSGNRLRIGVVWASKATGFESDPFVAKSIPLESLRPLTEIPDVSLYSLQTGPEATRLAAMPTPLRVIDLGSLFRDFSDTAAAIANLDLVITVDTAVLHLAGAMNRPCWGLLPYLPCWRWPVAGETTPWYASVRLFRQPAPGRWDQVIQDVCVALAAFASRRRAH